MFQLRVRSAYRKYANLSPYSPGPDSAYREFPSSRLGPLGTTIHNRI